MKFNPLFKDDTIYKAIAIIEKHYKDEEFLASICNAEKFNYTTHLNAQVSSAIKDSTLFVTIKPYRTWSPWSKVIGHAKGSTIYVNTRKLDLPLKDRVENIFHESLHLLGYSHRGNRNDEFNRGTVPYKCAELFVSYIGKIDEL